MTAQVDVLATYHDVSELFGALSSPVRAAIVHQLAERDHAVHELVVSLGLTQPLISQHLRVLRGARLVTTVRKGREVTYRLADEHVAHVFLDAFNHTQETPRSVG